MALLSIEPTLNVEFSINADYERESSRGYIAWTNLSDNEVALYNECGISIGSAHPSDTQQRCLGVNINLISQTSYPGSNTNVAALQWSVTAKYGLWNTLYRSPDGNPLHIPTRFRLDFVGEMMPALIDVDGDPIVNSAGDPYDPPVEFERIHATLTVMRNESGTNLASIGALSNTVNLNSWNGYPAKTVRLMPIRVPQIEYSQVTNTYYYPMEYVFEINFDTWVKQVLNQGYRQLDSNGNLVPIFINGQPAENPVALDENGHAILAPSFKDNSGNTPPDSNSGGTSGEPAGGGEPPEGGDGTNTTIVVNAFDVYRTMDFSASPGGLGMDNLFTLVGP